MNENFPARGFIMAPLVPPIPDLKEQSMAQQETKSWVVMII